jgi:poly(glycerol-phosphate) alpha-glucosyltransferase
VATTPLPSGRHFALAWTIPDAIGGLTSAMLHRSRAFASLAEVPVDILTFDDRLDYADVESRLRRSGDIVDGIRIVNLWDWLRTHPVRPTKAPLGSPERVFSPLAPDRTHRSAHRDGVELRRARLAADGRTVLQVDHFRAGGSLLASDRRDTQQRGTLGGRSIVLCGEDGRPVRSWSRSWSLYRWWLDQVTQGDAPSFLIADSKPVSRFIHTYRRADRTTIHVVHGSHLAGNIGPWGRLRPSRAEVFRHLGDYDAVVFLTERQRRDAETRFGRRSNLCVIPNSRTPPPAPQLERPPVGGAMVCTLSGLKRPQHAVRAILLARRLVPGLTLDIYGDGPRRAALERAIDRARARDAVRLHGYVPAARDRLAQASFLLMTSRSEGFGLVMLEAMGAGCIPIAYDIRYGPADLITPRIDGFLVTSGNILGLVRAIMRLQAMPPGEVLTMRAAARRTAERYSDAQLLPLWARHLAAARERNLRTLSGPSAAREGEP